MKRLPRLRGPGATRGFAFVAAIFVLVVLAALTSYVVNVAAGAATTSAIAVQGARAYEAARTGIEWGSYQAIDPNGTLAPGATNLPDCFVQKTLALPAAIGPFTVTVSCQRYPAFSASPNYHEEGAKRSVFYFLSSTATFGNAGASDYIERKLEATVEKCKDPDATGPTYAC
jgi:MSHA biogenesis protein MshP